MFVTPDGHWRVRVIILDEHEVLRVETDILPPARHLRDRRAGTVTMAGGWFWAGDTRFASGLSRFGVPVGSLEEVTS